MVNGQHLTFDLSGLYQDVFLMTDRQTGSVWTHLDGHARQGPMAGKRLRFVPLPMMPFSEWLGLYPSTLVLDTDTAYANAYRPGGIGQPNQNEALYGDDRLLANALVVGVEVNNEFVGFPIKLVAEAGGLVNADVAQQAVVVVYNPSSKTGIAYARNVADRILTFEADYIAEGFLLRDIETGSRWRVDGFGVDGPLAHTNLTFVPSFISEWYGWSGYHPNTGLYESPANQ